VGSRLTPTKKKGRKKKNQNPEKENLYFRTLRRNHARGLMFGKWESLQGQGRRRESLWGKG